MGAVIPDFGGNTYDPLKDASRLRKQIDKVRRVMLGGGWHRLAELAEVAECSEASASARLRDLRKSQYGGYDVQRRRAEGEKGVNEYRLAVPEMPAYAHGKSRSENAGAP